MTNQCLFSKFYTKLVVENVVAPGASNKRSSKVFSFFISQILVSLDTISD
jgi:hypothetical protein